MKWFALVIGLVLIGCSTEQSCDKLFEGLYPHESYNVIGRNDIRFYIKENGGWIYECYIGAAITTIKPANVKHVNR